MDFVKDISTIASAALPIREQWTIRRCRLSTDLLGPRLCITSGIHGDETVGQLIIYELSNAIQHHPEWLHGTVDLYPMLNPLGLDVHERMVPSHTLLDMNRAFPGAADGTPLETMCDSIMADVMDADLILDIHASTNDKNELYQVRMNYRDYENQIPKAYALCPDMIWVYPDLPSFDSSLTGALSKLGRDAFILEANACIFDPTPIARKIIHGIFCKMQEMNLFVQETIPERPSGPIPVVYSGRNITRVTCECAGIFVPVYLLGSSVKHGDLIGKIISAIDGLVQEYIYAPCDGLVFTERAYSAVYPGTLLARICVENDSKEKP